MKDFKYYAPTEVVFGEHAEEKIGRLVKRYGGNLACATAAYHAGQGQVDKWLENPEYSADGVTLSLIPSEATDTYVKRVLKYYEKYCELYAPEAA